VRVFGERAVPAHLERRLLEGITVEMRPSLWVNPEDQMMLYAAVRYFNANAIPGRLVMETGGFWGMIAACPKPVLGLPYSYVRLPPLFRGVSFYSIEVV
jgi:hypothetical protein